MSKAKGHKLHQDEDSTQRPEERTSFSAPLGALQQARLVVVSGSSGLELAGDAALPVLFRAQFGQGNPHVWLQNGIVTVKHHPRFSTRTRQPSPATITLNSTIPWEIELRQGVSRLEAGLAELQLGSLDILGSVSRCRLLLSRPSATTFIYIAGAVSRATLSIPRDSEIRLRIAGAVSGLRFDGRRVANAGNETQLQSAGFENAISRYDIYIAGAASNLTIARSG